jgi:hypothetical protein
VRVGGFWLAGIGLSLALTGGLLLALDSRKTDVDSQGNLTKGDPLIAPSVTFGLLGGGLLALVGGVAMIIASGTTVRDDGGTPIGSSGRRAAFTF